MERPRIVLLSAFLSPYRSGAEAMVEEVSKRLVDRYNITIVTSRRSRSLPKQSSLNGVNVVRVGIGSPFDKWLFPFLAPLAARRLHPQIIHAVLESFAGLGLVFCMLVVPSARRLLTCQSTNTGMFLGMIHRHAHRITVISSSLQKRAEHYGRLDAVVIPNGIDLNAINAARATTSKISGRVLFVGRLRSMKGVDTLIRAFVKVTDPRAHLMIVGDGDQRPSLEAITKELLLTERVTFFGQRSHEEVMKDFAEAEIFCGLSRSEALGNVFLEAQAAGCAVIATNVGGIPDIVKDGETGVLVPPDDATAAANAITQLLSNSEKRTMLTEYGIKNASRYDWKEIAEKYANTYKEIL